ncbi:MAG: helix-turn-helix domain-containing protein [Taibaiella sp.]|nr:helix-turn-helix domain-containing protein [Taibaiella sp.]
MSRPMTLKSGLKQFGEKLRWLRTQSGYSLQEVADALGYARHSYISEIETGKKIPTAEFALKAAQFFHLTTDELLRDDIILNSSPNRKKTMQGLPFVDREPTASEVEKIRLILSTFQDGTGMNDGGSRPGWRDFERAVAAALGGKALESKYIFDVLLTDSATPDVQYGLSCKMGNQQDRVIRQGRAFMELSNSAKKFWDYLQTKGINQANFKEQPAEVGTALLELVKSWHLKENLSLGGHIDIQKSSYLVLSYNDAGWYQLHQFPLDFPGARELHWYFPTRTVKKGAITGNLRADDNEGMIFEWYGQSGGQLKYYPPVANAIWSSGRFQLEPLAETVEDGLIAKAKMYFPSLWEQASREDEA